MLYVSNAPNQLFCIHSPVCHSHTLVTLQRTGIQDGVPHKKPRGSTCALGRARQHLLPLTTQLWCPASLRHCVCGDIYDLCNIRGHATPTERAANGQEPSAQIDRHITCTSVRNNIEPLANSCPLQHFSTNMCIHWGSCRCESML